MFKRIYSVLFCLCFFHKGMHNFQEVIKLQNIYCALFNNVIIIFQQMHIIKRFFLSSPCSVFPVILITKLCFNKTEIMVQPLSRRLPFILRIMNLLRRDQWIKVSCRLQPMPREKKCSTGERETRASPPLCKLSAWRINCEMWKLIQRKWTS